MSAWGLISWGKRGAWGKATGIPVPAVESADLGALIVAAQKGQEDLPAELSPAHLQALAASVYGVGPFDLPAFTTAIPPQNLPASTTAIPGVDLGATGGAHPPEDIKAQLAAVLPVDLPVYIRGGFSDVYDLGASLTQTGFFENISAYLNTAQQAVLDLGGAVKVIAQSAKDLAAVMQPYHEKDLPASIITQRVFDTRAIITGVFREATANLGALIQRIESTAVDLPVDPVRAVVSTHTSDKLPNLDKVSRRFFENRYVFGTRSAGLVVLTIEPVFGIFPDLHAQIFAIQLFRENISAFIRVAAQEVKDLSTSMTSVSSFINVSQLIVDLIPLINLNSELVQVGGFSPIKGSITPKVSASTGTAEDAGFITTASSYRFYLGTSNGLFIPPQVTPQIRITTYRNNFPRPDLHATIAGWHEADISASISDFPFIELPATLGALDISTIAHISATIGTFNISDLSSSLTPFGAFEGITADITTQGKVEDLPASILPFISPLAFNVVSVSTMPSIDLGAIINYGNLVRCAPTSTISNLGGYLKPFVSGTEDTQQDLPASLNVLRVQLDLPAELTARKRTRIRTLGLTFTAKTRDSERIRASITPVAPSLIDLSAEISGLLHEVDLPASLTPFRYEPHDVDFTATETVANLATGETKQVLLSFRSQVSFYVYDAVSEAVYATDRGTWAIDLRSAGREDSFFDRSATNRTYAISEGFQEFYSLDEAIRNAIVLLCERRQENVSASIFASGGVSDLPVQLNIISSDRMGNLAAKIAAVANSPDISASINASLTQFSGYTQAAANITPQVTEVIKNIGANIAGNIVEDLGAEISVV